jgi:zinc transporter ZupT
MIMDIVMELNVYNNNIVLNKKNDDEEDEDDLQEEVLKNVVSSKGKFASFLQQRNSIIGGVTQEKQDPALVRASMILNRNFSKSFHDDLNLMVNPKNVNIGDNHDKEHQHDHDHKQETFKVDNAASLITPLLLLTALSLHGFFEGMAMGFQGSLKDTLFLGGAIIAHKWAEAFTLGISFTKAGTDKKTFLILIIIFSMFTPLGILLGLILPASAMIEGIVLGLSTGTFIYVAASEVIVEEFAVTKYKFQKFIWFMIGGIFVGFLAMLERFTEEH